MHVHMCQGHHEGGGAVGVEHTLETPQAGAPREAFSAILQLTMQRASPQVYRPPV